MEQSTMNDTELNSRTGMFFTVRSNGQIYVNSQTYSKFFSDSEYVSVIVDKEEKKLGIVPASEDEPDARTSSRNRVSCAGILKDLGINVTGDPQRYPVKIDEDEGFPFIEFELDNSTLELRTDGCEVESERPSHFVKTKTGHLHAPAKDSTMEDPRPACARTSHRGWEAKTPEQVPVGFYEHCRNCEKVLKEVYGR